MSTREDLEKIIREWCAERGDDNPMIDAEFQNSFWHIQVASSVWDGTDPISARIEAIWEKLREVVEDLGVVCCFSLDEWTAVNAADEEDIEHALVRFGKTMLQIQTRMLAYTEGAQVTRSTLDSFCELAEGLAKDMQEEIDGTENHYSLVGDV